MSLNKTSSDDGSDGGADSGEDSNAFIWAVSYSDLLMLLTCFFIIFFNIDDAQLSGEGKAPNKDVAKKETPAKVPEKDGGQLQFSNQMNMVLVKLKDMIDTQTIKEPRTFFQQLKGNSDGKGAGGKFTNLKDMLKTGDDEKTKQRLLNNRGIIIDFKDDFYDVGQFNLSEENKASLKRIIEIITPYYPYFNLVFIGYADQLPIRNVSSEKVIDSNMVLSMMRAAKAVEFSLELGLDSMWVSAQGMGENVRQTRSLSLKIIER